MTLVCGCSGRTMDYGPFGFMERYDPLWSPFTSDPERKFGLRSSPALNLITLTTPNTACFSVYVS